MEKKYINLGLTLREIRTKTGEGIKTTSNKLGLDYSYLSKLENGLQRPSKQVLNQLIAHFNLTSSEARDIFMLAGYRRGVVSVSEDSDFQTEKVQSKPEILVRSDQVTLYSDSVGVDVNQYGFVLSFAQTLGPNKQLIVSRIGMSKEHIKSLVRVLSELLDKAEGKLETRKTGKNG